MPVMLVVCVLGTCMYSLRRGRTRSALRGALHWIGCGSRTYYVNEEEQEGEAEEDRRDSEKRSNSR